MKTEIVEIKSENQKLQSKYKKLQVKKNTFMGKYEQERILAEIKDLLQENETLKMVGRELRAELDYSRQRENKLMYFLFVMQKNELPVFDIFQEHIKDLKTS